MLNKHVGMPLFGLMMAQAARMDDATPPNVADASQRLQERAKMPKQLSASAIKAFFEGDQAQKDQHKVAAADKGRMSWMLGLMFKAEKAGDAVKYEPVVDFATVKTATAEYVKDKATESGWKGGKGAPKPPAPVKAARVRASEVKTLYGAIRFASFDPAGKGYHDAIAGAREALLASGIKPDGTKIPDDEMRKRQRIASQEAAKVSSAAKAAAKAAAELGRPLTDAERAEIFGNAEGAYRKEAAENICADILKRFGVKVAEEVAAIMPQAIQEFEATKETPKSE